MRKIKLYAMDERKRTGEGGKKGGVGGGERDLSMF